MVPSRSNDSEEANIEPTYLAGNDKAVRVSLGWRSNDVGTWLRTAYTRFCFFGVTNRYLRCYPSPEQPAGNFISSVPQSNRYRRRDACQQIDSGQPLETPCPSRATCDQRQVEPVNCCIEFISPNIASRSIRSDGAALVMRFARIATTTGHDRAAGVNRRASNEESVGQGRATIVLKWAKEWAYPSLVACRRATDDAARYALDEVVPM